MRSRRPQVGIARVYPAGGEVAQTMVVFCRGGFEGLGPGSMTPGASAADRCAAATFLRIACPVYRSPRPSRCSKSTGLAGRFQWTTEWRHPWKSIPSWPTDVVASTNGQNGELKAARTSGGLASSWLWRVLGRTAGQCLGPGASWRLEECGCESSPALGTRRREPVHCLSPPGMRAWDWQSRCSFNC